MGCDIFVRIGVDYLVIELGGMFLVEVESIVVVVGVYDWFFYEICYFGDMWVFMICIWIESFKYWMGGKCGLVVVDMIKYVDLEDKGVRFKVDKVIVVVDCL